ncbi:hypothetical protein [Actinacidiphila acididurans]|uniref:Uncharacterized protein n=1 Tax=Actinacidiphila acididurans TaxID=2784346 RepID=A0ABS2TWG5_9ACTN|nr:hypothetical protein [Actinacidiphila acididurans]MBM9506630.1 hypothetical protein [Actinacidiphila acididurans]
MHAQLNSGVLPGLRVAAPRWWMPGGGAEGVTGRARAAARWPGRGDVDAVRADRRIHDALVQADFGAGAAQLAGEVAARFISRPRTRGVGG